MSTWPRAGARAVLCGPLLASSSAHGEPFRGVRLAVTGGLALALTACACPRQEDVGWTSGVLADASTDCPSNPYKRGVEWTKAPETCVETSSDETARLEGYRLVGADEDVTLEPGECAYELTCRVKDMACLEGAPPPG